MQIQLKYKNITLLIISVIVLYTIFNIGITKKVTSVINYFFPSSPFRVCSSSLKWHQQSSSAGNPYNENFKRKGTPLIALFGPPGSGVEWLRLMIEQMTGLHTGSVNYGKHEVFEGEGKLKDVVVVMSYDMEALPHFTKAIVIYRSMRETVRAAYAQKHGSSPGELEAPLHAYYGKAWPVFALRESRQWADRYNRYFADDKPTMIIAYDELANPDTVQRQLLKITNFLQVPIRQSALMCTADAAQRLPLKPPSLRHAFDPYLLLSVSDLPRLHRMANLTEAAISHAREQYRPRV